MFFVEMGLCFRAPVISSVRRLAGRDLQGLQSLKHRDPAADALSRVEGDVRFRCVRVTKYAGPEPVNDEICPFKIAEEDRVFVRADRVNVVIDLDGLAEKCIGCPFREARSPEIVAVAVFHFANGIDGRVGHELYGAVTVNGFQGVLEVYELVGIVKQ